MSETIDIRELNERIESTSHLVTNLITGIKSHQDAVIFNRWTIQQDSIHTGFASC